MYIKYKYYSFNSISFILHNHWAIAGQLPDYQLVKLLNKNGSFRISSKVFTHSKKGFSSYVKNIIIETYEVQCNIVNCVSCRI